MLRIYFQFLSFITSPLSHSHTHSHPHTHIHTPSSTHPHRKPRWSAWITSVPIVAPWRLFFGGEQKMETPSVTRAGSTTSSMGWVWWQVCEGVYFVKVWACEGMCIVEEDCKQRDIFMTTWISIFDSWFWVKCFGSRHWNQKLRCAIATECSCVPVCVCFQWFGVGGEWVWWAWAVGRWIVCVIRSNMYLMYCCYEDNALHLHHTHVCVIETVFVISVAHVAVSPPAHNLHGLLMDSISF